LIVLTEVEPEDALMRLAIRRLPLSDSRWGCVALALPRMLRASTAFRGEAQPGHALVPTSPSLLAKDEPQKGKLWHAYRRKWATERKHLPDVDVAAAGGRANTVSLKTAYQHTAAETMFRVVLLGAIAQLGERLLCKQEVAGSIPAGSICSSRRSGFS
jgi:hypothetical protein